MDQLIERLRGLSKQGTRPYYELIAAEIEQAITAAHLRAGDRMPPVRALAQQLGSGGATIAAAYNLLNRHGWTRGEVGRGTFVVGRPAGDANRLALASSVPRWSSLRRPAPWRRRALQMSTARLRAAYPQALDCTSGKPDVTLLPTELLKQAWHAAVDATAPADLQYAGPEPGVALGQQLLPRLAADGIPARVGDLVVGSSAQQFLVLAAGIVSQLAGDEEPVIVVEEPGYHTAIDTFERLGCRVIGVAVDEQGAVPASLAAALDDGAHAVVFSPRVHNPTGGSWSVRRVGELADVLVAYPEVVVLEDDQFAGLAAGQPGSLIGDRRVEDRVIYIRSFAKAIAPDLRLAVAVARPRLRAALVEAKTFADGWSPRLAQRVLAHALADPALDAALRAARAEYALRRGAVLHEVATHLVPVGGWAAGEEGVNVWVHLPLGVDAVEVVEHAAGLGALLAPGEPFFIRPGHGDVVRLSVGSIDAVQAGAAARALTAAVLMTAAHPDTMISV